MTPGRMHCCFDLLRAGRLLMGPFKDSTATIFSQKKINFVEAFMLPCA